MSGQWTLEGFDTFSSEEYPLDGSYPTEEAAREVARARLEALEQKQPTIHSGGQAGIQDRVYVVRPNGSKYRFVP